MRDDVSDKADLEALAERYLDLWQNQVTAMATDADFATAFQNLFGLAAGPAMGGASPLAAWQAMMAGAVSPQGAHKARAGTRH